MVDRPDAPRAMDAVPLTPDPVTLAIAIPAFGRGAAIVVSIAAMAREARDEELDIAFYVSDDTPDSSVEAALRPLLAAGLPVRYRRNSPSLGHDRNIVATLLWPDARHVWLMGSGWRATPGLLAPIVRCLDGHDLLFLNVHAGARPAVAATRGKAARVLLREMLWHQTLTGATIYGPAVRRWVEGRGNSLRVFRNFPQISMILGFASAQDLVVGWFAERSLHASGSEDASYWRSKAIDVFARDWPAAVAAFPDIVPASAATGVIRAHSARTDLFNSHALLELRRSGQFRWSSLRHRGVRRAMHLPLWKLVAILALPIPLLRAGSAALGRAKRWRGQ